MSENADESRPLQDHGWVGACYKIDRKSPNYLKWSNTILDTQDVPGSVIIAPAGGGIATSDVSYSSSAQETSSNLAGSFSFGGSYGPFSGEVSASYEANSNISGTFLRIQRDILCTKKSASLASLPYQEDSVKTVRKLLAAKIKKNPEWGTYADRLEKQGFEDIDTLLEAFQDLDLESKPYSLPKGFAIQLRKLVRSHKTSSAKINPGALRCARNNSAEEFVREYGEVYATKVVLGGVFRVIHITETSEQYSSEQMKASFEAEYKALFCSVKASGSVAKGTSSVNRNANTTTTSVAQGGDTEVWLQLTKKNLDQVQAKWAKTVKDDKLYPIELTVRPIWELLKEDTEAQKKVENHLRRKWKRDTDALKILDIKIRKREHMSIGGMASTEVTIPANARYDYAKYQWSNATCMTSHAGHVLIICGRVGGCKGGGGIYRVDPASGAWWRLPKSGDWHWMNASCMTTCGDEVFVVCGRKDDRAGGGGIWAINPVTGTARELPGHETGWQNATVMTSMNGKLYIIAGQIMGCNGGGGMYEVDPKTGAQRQVPVADGGNVQVLAGFHDNLYHIAGNMGSGSGVIKAVDPRTGTFEGLTKNSGWGNATLMVATDSHLFIVCGRMRGCKGEGKLYKVESNGDWHYMKECYPDGWKTATCMTSIGDKLYIVCGFMGGCDGWGGLYEVHSRELTVREVK